MGETVVFYFDVLGFSGLTAQEDEAAVDVLGDLATCLSLPPLQGETRRWQHRYALSDSEFLIHDKPQTAVVQAADLAFNLFQVSRGQKSGDPKTPILIRGGLGFGTVTHLRGIFEPEDPQPRNLVGPGVLEAVQLEQAGLRGPRILLRDTLVAALPGEGHEGERLRKLLRPTEISEIWELLWPLPVHDETFESGVTELAGIHDQALRDLAEHGGHPDYGAHYRELVLLVARSIECFVTWLEEVDETRVPAVVDELVPLIRIQQILDTSPGLPPLFVLQWRDLLERARRKAG